MGHDKKKRKKKKVKPKVVRRKIPYEKLHNLCKCGNYKFFTSKRCRKCQGIGKGSTVSKMMRERRRRGQED